MANTSRRRGSSAGARRRPSSKSTSRRRYSKKRRRSGGGIKLLGLVAAAVVIVLAGFGIVKLLGSGGSASASPKNLVVILDTGTIPTGTTIDGVDVGGMSAMQARETLAEKMEQKTKDYSITLVIPGTEKQETIPGDTLGIRPDVDAAIERAINVMRHGTISERQMAIDEVASTGNAITTSHTYDMEVLRSALSDSELISAEANEPQAIFDPKSATFSYTDGKDGLAVDTDKLVELVAAEIESGTFGTVEVPGEKKAATMDLDTIKANTQRRASAETKFDQRASSYAPNRVHNIITIANKLNGAKIMPGHEFSVNDHVGPRTDPNIWKPAPGIADGDYTEQLGGGICQVSTTLYQALLKADLKITERQNHSLTIGYAKRGLDATISTGSPNLKFVNNTEWPLYLYVGVDTGSKTVVCRIYGSPLEDGMTIQLRSETESEVPMPSPVIVTDPEKVRAGSGGYVVRAYKDYYDKNGKKIKTVEAHKSTYKATAPHVLNPSDVVVDTEPTPSPETTPTPPPVDPQNSPTPPPVVPPTPTPHVATPAPTQPPVVDNTPPPVVDNTPPPASPAGGDDIITV